MSETEPRRGGLSADVTRRDDTVTIALAGEFDLATRATVERAIVPMEAGQRLVLDLTGLTFMDSTGVRIVMELDVRARKEGWTLIIARAPAGPVQRLLDLCSVGDRVRIVDHAAAVE